MGRPYKTELQNLEETFKWVMELPIADIKSFINKALDTPLITVGSGGALTAAHLISLLHQTKGSFSKAVTPLDMISNAESLRDVSVLIFSAGGRNPDAQSALKLAITSEPRNLMVLSMKEKSPLSDLAKNFHVNFQGFNIPSGKDGFLATNSLLAFLVLLIRAYDEYSLQIDTFSEWLSFGRNIIEHPDKLTKSLLSKDSWIVLYSKWGLPAAVDMESKLSEVALKHVQMVDYRNFAHGRHYWLSKRRKETGVLALVTPADEMLSRKTLSLLPKGIPVLRLATKEIGPIGSLDLFIKVLHLVYLVGAANGIDPGRPYVPEFGRRIYHLRLPEKKRLSKEDDRRITAIRRKSKVLHLDDLSNDYLDYWIEAYQEYLREISTTIFGAIVFDYDGTLCEPNNRYSGLSHEIAHKLVDFLQYGIVVGIATGRGKSVRQDLQRVIPEKYWKQIYIGYYNGADLASLTDKSHPNTSNQLHPSLQPIQDALGMHLAHLVDYECRPQQITLEPKSPSHWKLVKALVNDLIVKRNLDNIQILESSHSIDVIAPGVSKLLLVRACEQIAAQLGNLSAVLCIGDRGEWPGNDFDLLSEPYSLSVDTVSSDPKSCWNLCEAGYKGVLGTLEYLKYAEISHGNFRLKIKE